MIYDYVNTKPPLEEVYLEHGWLKDQAAKVYKYISRWRGKNGKWYYSYKSKAQELGAKIDRNIKGIKADEISDNTYNDYTTGKRRIIGKTSRYVIGKDSGKAGSRSVGLSSNRPGFKGNITRVSSKISRKPKGNKSLKDRGYSGSRGSGESKRQSNLGTRKSTKSMITKSNMTSKVRRGQAIGSNVKYDKPFKMGNVVDAKTGKLGATHYGSYRTRDFIDRANGRNAQKRNVRYSPTYKTKYTWDELKKKNRKQHRYA